MTRFDPIGDFVAAVGAGDAPDFDVADGMIRLASRDPASVSKALGVEASVPEHADAVMRDAYFDVLSDNVLDTVGELAYSKAVSEENSMLDSKFRYAGIDDASASRIMFDSSIGDTLAQDRVDKRFYFD